MKKTCILLSLILCISLFSSCSDLGETNNVLGDTSNVEIISVDSEYFSQEEILAAIEVVELEFTDFKGCTLTKIGYIGDEKLVENIVGDKPENPQFIVLDCEFETSSISANEGLDPNVTYEYGWWKWYLSKDDTGNWKIDNWGMV